MEYGFLALLVFVIILYFHTLLSGMENERFGLILPIISFVASFVWLVIGMKEISVHSLISAVFTLALANIPTYIMLAIYRHKRKNLKK